MTKVAAWSEGARRHPVKVFSKVNVYGLGVTLLAAGGCGPVTPPSDASIIAFLLASSKLNVSIAFPKSIVLIRAITIMIADSDPRLSSRANLNAVLAALGLVALSMHCPSRVNAQTAQAPIAQVQTLHPPRSSGGTHSGFSRKRGNA